MTEKAPKPPLSISSSAFCGLMIANGLLVASACYSLVLPMMQERAELLSRVGDQSGEYEVRYLGVLPGVGLLIATGVALPAVAYFRRRSRRDNAVGSPTP